MGTPAPAAKALERLLSSGHDVAAVYTQPDRPSGRGNKVTASPVKEFALSRGIRVLQPRSVTTAEALDDFRSIGAEVSVVVAYGRILPTTFLEAPKYGAINVHYSLLPKYRGAAPVNWAIVNGETTTGVTTMKMDAGLDTGDILIQEDTEIREDETAIELMSRLSEIGADVLVRTLTELGSIVPIVQDDTKATYAPLMKKSDGFINWTLPASDIVNRVRGFQPFPSSFSFLRGMRLTLWKAEAIRGESSGAPGEILSVGADEWLVQCGAGTMLKIIEAQQEGKRRMAAADIINGVRPKVGEMFGASPND